MWFVWWLFNDDFGCSGEIDLIEWYGNGIWLLGIIVYVNLDGIVFEICLIGVDGGWYNWCVMWNLSGMYFWLDYVDGIEFYFLVLVIGIEDFNEFICEWLFNDFGYMVFLVLNFVVGGFGGGDFVMGFYLQEMFVDWVCVF